MSKFTGTLPMDVSTYMDMLEGNLEEGVEVLRKVLDANIHLFQDAWKIESWKKTGPEDEWVSGLETSYMLIVDGAKHPAGQVISYAQLSRDFNVKDPSSSIAEARQFLHIAKRFEAVVGVLRRLEDSGVIEIERADVEYDEDYEGADHITENIRHNRFFCPAFKISSVRYHSEPVFMGFKINQLALDALSVVTTGKPKGFKDRSSLYRVTKAWMFENFMEHVSWFVDGMSQENVGTTFSLMEVAEKEGYEKFVVGFALGGILGLTIQDLGSKDVIDEVLG